MAQSSPKPESTNLSTAGSLAGKGQFSDMVDVCQRLVDAAPNDINTLASVGNLFLNTGHLSYAQQCFERILKFSSTDLSSLAGLAHIAQAQAQHHKARQLYERLEQLYPNNPVIKRNALLQLEYDPHATELERYQKAMAWGNWVTQGKLPPRPPLTNPHGRILNIGYVSADFCQHTVGLMVRDVITQHNPERFKVFTYYAGNQIDWVTKIFERKTHFRYCHALNDQELSQAIKKDQIDILVDLSGHTAGSRLSVFALRPAPIQISWLGYFATTGLKTIDAVLLDEASTTTSTQNYFCEQIIKLPSRLCYSPVPFTPEIAEAPHKRNGYITFGSFNNTAKLNYEVIRVWAQILQAVPNSRLILKWRTFNDKPYRQGLLDQFAQIGIDKNRIELRAPSFHVDVLKEYADIDIALDPFPFTGGQTTCDALMMGVPVITLAQERPVSRQSASILRACGLEGSIAKDHTSYVGLAQKLSGCYQTLTEMRVELRQRLLNARICDPNAYQQNLADMFNQMVRKEYHWQ